MNIAPRLLLIGGVVVAGCGSPEATRTRGGAPGADVGNRPNIVEMHAGSMQFWKTPGLIGTLEHPPLAPSHQAESLSRE